MFGLQAINPVAFSIGSLEVRWYGILIAFGIILAFIVVQKEMEGLSNENFFIVIMTAFFCFFTSGNSKANSESELYERIFFTIGYTEVNEALQKCATHFERPIALPTQVPPIPFTHMLGRFNDSEGNENDELEIKFLHKDLSQNHYTIRIKPLEYGLEIKEEEIDQKIQLEDGNEAIFSNKIKGFDLLIFEKYGYQYILSIDEKKSKEITQEVLIRIANSIR